MRRLARLRLILSVVLVALAAWLGGARPALASGDGAIAPALEAPPPAADAPALTLPADVPVLVAPSQVTIPPVPSDYVTRDLGWLTLSHPPGAAERVQPLVDAASGIRAELTAVFGQRVLERVEVRVVPTVTDMARLAPVSAPPPAYASGVAYPRLHLALLSMLAPRGGEAEDLDQVFRHELSHLALEDAVAGRHVPAWFNEGFAVLFAGENGVDRQKVLWSATISGTLLPLSDLDRGFPTDRFEVNIAYAESADFVRFLRRRSDELRFASMIERVREGQSFDRALAVAYGTDLRTLEFQWRSDVERRYSIIPVLAGGGLLWVGVIGVLGWGYVRRRKRARAVLARWAEEEAIEDAMIARRLAEEREAKSGFEHVALVRSPAKVEHEGGWHTLH